MVKQQGRMVGAQAGACTVSEYIVI
jgi:hypothetical protein